MKRISTATCLVSLTLIATACQPLHPPDPAPPARAMEGQTFAQQTCSGCHAIGATGWSHNPNAPPFPAIVNQEGLTAETLTTWLKGAHNYPAEMDFYLNDAQVDELVSYMLTLKDPNYRRPPE